MPSDPASLDVLAVVGIIIMFAFAIGQLCRQLGLPQVIGFIVAGVLLGPSFLKVVPTELHDSLTFVTELALGLIGFEMGEHLLFDEMRHLGQSILVIVVLQAFGALVFVTAGVMLVTRSLPTALVLGAVAMATAPAATVDVLAEYGAEGPFTTTLLAVIGIDDALTLLVFSIIASVVEPMIEAGSNSFRFLFGGGDTGISLADMIELPVYEIGGALVLGTLFGLILTRIMHHVRTHHAPERRQHDAMAFSIAFIFFATGLSRTIDLSLILTTMVMGIVVVNLEQRNARFVHFTIEHAGPVIYVLFFALVGAGIHLEMLPTMGLLGIVFIVTRIVGKYSGAWLGGYLTRTPRAIRDNLGLALLSQAGVAIGLALEAEHRFAPMGEKGVELAELVVSVVTATLFVVQIVGPLMVKVAITRAGEIGRAYEDQLADNPPP